MKKTALIVIDHNKRELFGCLLLVRYLKELGIRATLCNRYSFDDYYFRHVPDAVIVPNAFRDLSDFAKSSCIFVLPSESGNGQPDQILATHGISDQHPVYSECVDRFFCWGPAMKEILRGSGTWHKEQLAVTGSPSTDHWLLPLQKSSSTDLCAGLTTTFRVLGGDRRKDYFKWLDQAERSGGDGTYYRPPEHVESWLFLEASLGRGIAQLIRTLSVDHQQSLKIRPHPVEYVGRYDYFRNLSEGRVQVGKEGTISDWLRDISVLFTFLSASALDALIQGVPVVSLRGLVDSDALRKIPQDFRYVYEDFLWQLESVDQAVEFAEAAQGGKLALCRDEKELSVFLTRHFLYPRKHTAAQLIAQEIGQTLDETSKKRKSITGHGFKAKFRRRLPMGPQVRGSILYLYGLLPGRQNIGFSYQPWRLWNRITVGQTVKAVWDAVGWQKVQRM